MRDWKLREVQEIPPDRSIWFSGKAGSGVIACRVTANRRLGASAVWIAGSTPQNAKLWANTQ